MPADALMATSNEGWFMTSSILDRRRNIIRKLAFYCDLVLFSRRWTPSCVLKDGWITQLCQKHERSGKRARYSARNTVQHN